MSGTLFWDVDTQYDFMRADGKLYVPDAEAIIPTLKQLTDGAHRTGVRILASADDHLPGHRELSDRPDFRETFPPHCLRGTPGQKKIPETALHHPLVIEPELQPAATVEARVRAHAEDILVNKHWFDVFTNPNVEAALAALDPDRIFLYGVALDVCDRYAIEGLLARRPQTRLFALTDAMKPIDTSRAAALLADWRRRGVTLLTSADALRMVSR